MTTTLAHRGPDAAGTWRDDAAGIALGHRRLAIVDLSPQGRQPMDSASGRLTLVFNGEIYNFRELRRDLEAAGDIFRGGSDTEVLLAAIERWGIDATLRRAVGMFAIALWDRAARTLTLARDPLGKKPLYVALHRGSLLFASELKALHAFPGFAPGIDRGALTLFVRYAYVPDPHAILEGVVKLPPGTRLTVRADELAELDTADLLRRTTPFWTLAEHIAPVDLDEATALEELDRHLRTAVAERMIADVPLGAFLSGGIDSSLVVALMQAQSTRPVRTFTIGFDAGAGDEAADARAVAGHLGTEHTELRVTGADSLAVVPDLPTIFDEPFADPSQIPTYLVSRLARQHVTVALSGDGGDEVFGGYQRHLAAGSLERLCRIPLPLRKAAGSVLRALGPAGWDRVFDTGRRLGLVGRGASGDRIHKAAGFLDLAGPAEMYRDGFVSRWRDPKAIVVGGHEPPTVLRDHALDDTSVSDLVGRLPDLAGRMMALDTLTYLPGDILVKVDRASMAVALEARSPLLDRRVVEFAWSLPTALKIRDGRGKHLLRRLLDRHVPRALVDRPKQGFGPPLRSWLQGPLRDWAGDLLDESRLRREGWLEPAPIRRWWQDHQAGRRNHAYELWSVLMFQAWHERWATPAAPIGSRRIEPADGGRIRERVSA